MSKASEMMEGVERSEWPFGYLFVETVMYGKSPKLHEHRCELCLRFGEIVNVTLNFRIVEADAGKRYYSVMAFKDNVFKHGPCDGEIFFSETDYVDEHSCTAIFNVTFVEKGLEAIMEPLLHLLHPMVADWIMKMPEPTGEDGIPIHTWYMCFNAKRLKDIEYLSSVEVRSMIDSLISALKQLA